MDIESERVESAPHVAPVRWSDHPLVPEAQHLPASHEIEPAFAVATQTNVRLPNIPAILVRRRIRHSAIEERAGILRHSDKLNPFRWLNINADPQLGQIVPVIDSPVT